MGDPAARLLRTVAVDLASLTVPVGDGARGRLAHDNRVVGEVHQPLSLRQLVQQIPALGDVAPEAHATGDHAGRVRQRLDANPVAAPAIRLLDLEGSGPAVERGSKERLALVQVLRRMPSGDLRGAHAVRRRHLSSGGRHPKLVGEHNQRHVGGRAQQARSDTFRVKPPEISHRECGSSTPPAESNPCVGPTRSVVGYAAVHDSLDPAVEPARRGGAEASPHARKPIGGRSGPGDLTS